jgi:hypothetical protein
MTQEQMIEELLRKRCFDALERQLITGFGSYHENGSVTKWTIDIPTNLTNKDIQISAKQLDQYLTGIGC